MAGFGFKGWVTGLAFAMGLLASQGACAAPTLLVFGDSLAAGYGIDARTGWVTLLADKLKSQAAPDLNAWRVVNASVSGETTSGGLSRLPAALATYQPALLLIELGGNDGTSAQPVPAMRANLVQMIELARAAHAQPVLMEIRIPENFGPVYTTKFTQAFPDIAKDQGVPLIPFFLAPIALDRAQWFQADGIHPNADAQPRILDWMWNFLPPLLAKAAASAHASRP